MSTISNESVTQEAVLEALSKVNDPELHKSLTSLGMIQNVAVCDGSVSFDLVLTTSACPLKEGIKQSAKQAVEALPGVKQVTVNISGKTLGAFPGTAKPGMSGASNIPAKQPVPGIQNIIAVSSGKGGVGKSTVSTNLACAMVKAGAKVGILDADIYGPNVPLMMGLSKGKISSQSESGKLVPPENHGVKVMSMAFLLKEDQPVVWRGPMLDKVIRQFLTDTEWGELDYLIIDLPPGTGDAQLTIIQAVPVAGAVIVTTPQDVALLDSKKGLAMFQNAHIPVLGIVENMSHHICSHCGGRDDIFGHGGGSQAAETLNVPFLGEIPLATPIRLESDQGKPIVVADSETEQGQKQAEALTAIAHKVIAALCELGIQASAEAADNTNSQEAACCAH